MFFSCDVGDYQDCNSVINGGAYFDECGNCVGGKTGLTECTTDCNGILGGTSFLNPCDICVEGNTGIKLDSCTSLSYNGEIYRTIIIGNQVWLGEDLRTKNFNNNLPIPDFEISEADSIGTKLVIPNSAIQTDQVFYSPLAALNNIIAPDGWRVPTKSDIENLLEQLGGDSIASGKLKETEYENWNFPNQFATNESGFSAKGTGYRGSLGTLKNVGERYSFWSINTFDEGDTTNTLYWTLRLSFNSNYAILAPDSANIGHPIRLIKNNK
tara:strand:+ start:207 stop:1013 length:807 start_codon:yes stop_codon:yes gene_type:complete